MTVFLFLCVWVLQCYGTVDFYGNVWGCTPPNLSQSYMGGPAQKGTQLSLTIDDIPIKEFDGYESNTDGYKLKLKSVHDWHQYVIFMDTGTLEHDRLDVECEGHRIMQSDIEIEVEFTWIPAQSNNDIATLTVGYAPHYTLISVQTFQISSAHMKSKHLKEL